MRRKLVRLVMFLCVIVGLVSAVAAQGTTGAPASAPSNAETQIAEGEAIVANGIALSEQVNSLIRDATDDNDMMMVTCLTDKLTEIDGNVDIAKARLAEMRKATDAGTRVHEGTVLSVVADKLGVLGQEAGQCAGKDLYKTDESTTVDTIIDETMLTFENNPSVPPVVLPPSLPTLPPPESGLR